LEARRQLMMFTKAIEELSERRRAILIAARLDEMPHQQIAERFGISKRMVQLELKYALVHCKDALSKIDNP
jgi:RNA polymerase sigma factor (sigma-70 family)